MEDNTAYSIKVGSAFTGISWGYSGFVEGATCAFLLYVTVDLGSKIVESAENGGLVAELLERYIPEPRA